MTVTVGLVVAAFIYRSDFAEITSLAGYSLLGLFIVSFIAASAVSITLVPIPYALLVLTLPNILEPRWGVLAPVFVGATSAAGATLGELPTFLIGYGSRRVSETLTSRINQRLYRRATGWAGKYGSLAVFATSAIINPVHLPLTLAIASIRFPPGKWLLFTLLGNLCKTSAIAFSGYFALRGLFQG